MEYYDPSSGWVITVTAHNLKFSIHPLPKSEFLSIVEATEEANEVQKH